jgi:hypothetical protein
MNNINRQDSETNAKIEEIHKLIEEISQKSVHYRSGWILINNGINSQVYYNKKGCQDAYLRWQISYRNMTDEQLEESKNKLIEFRNELNQHLFEMGNPSILAKLKKHIFG